MPSILFVCTANQFRSPIAVASMLKSLAQAGAAGEWTVESAGTWTKPGMRAAALAIRASGQLGLYGLASHRTRQIDRDLLDPFDLILVMENGQKEGIASEFPEAGRRCFLLSEVTDGIAYDIPDPADHGVDAYQVASEIDMLIAKGRERLLQLAETLHRDRSR